MDVNVWNVNGMIMTREDRSTRGKTRPSATFLTKNSHMVWPSVYLIWIIREMYEKEIQEEIGVSDVMRWEFKTGRYHRKLKRGKYLRFYEKEIQEKQISHRL